MLENKTYVSIIVPVLNGEKYIGRCLESMNTLTYPKNNFEIIVVDNGSTDRTVTTIENFRRDHNIDVKLYFQKIKSSYAARNIGVKNAKGDIIAFTDADCIVDKDWLTNAVVYFSDMTVGGIAGEILSQRGDSIVERYAVDSEILSQKRKFNSGSLPYAQTANAIYRKELFYKIGYFDEILSGGDADYSWRILLGTDYKIIYAEDTIVLHKNRTSLKGLFKQTFKHGYGYELLKNKYEHVLKCNNICNNICKVSNNKSNNKDSRSNNKDSSHRIIKLMTNYIRQKNGLLILPAMINVLGFILGKLYAKFTLLTHKDDNIKEKKN